MAKKVTFSYILKNKDRKVTESFARAKYFGVYYGKKAVISLRQFPKDVKNAKQRIELLEEVFAYLLVIEAESKNKKVKQKEKKIKDSASQRYATYVSDVAGSKAEWRKLVFVDREDIIANEQAKRKADKKKLKKKYRKSGRMTRFSYYEIPVSTRSEIYKKYFRFRVIKSKMFRKHMEELEFFVDLNKPVRFDFMRANKMMKLLYDIIFPHALKSYRNIRKRKDKEQIQMILRFYYDFKGKRVETNLKGWGFPRLPARSEKMLSENIMEALRYAVISNGRDRRAPWLRYLDHSNNSYLYVHGFNIQFTYPTRFKEIEQINLKDYKNDFIGSNNRK